MTDERIECALRQARIVAAIRHVRLLSGGCIHNARRIELDDGRTLVAKIGDRAALAQFVEESAGLRALADTQTVVVPTPIGAFEVEGESVFLLNYVEPGFASDCSWQTLGTDLAALHAADVGRRYGFQITNHLGATKQVNTWHDDWVEFNRECRFGPQLCLARSRGLIDGGNARAVDQLIDRLDRFIPRHPRPSLIHGDLWSGNALPTTNDRIALIDPAPSISDGWADIAMMKLFGGFRETCYDSYRSNVEDCDDVETRIFVYQAYHLLNHVNIFGLGYLEQTMSLIRRLLH